LRLKKVFIEVCIDNQSVFIMVYLQHGQTSPNARVRTSSSSVRGRVKEKEGEREREGESERERGRERERVRKREYLFLKGIPGALAPFSYLVCKCL
jgi:hypothetical protein